MMTMADMTAFERCKHFGVSNIRGIAYIPGPSNYTKTAGKQYFDSDCYNKDFEQLWGGVGDNNRRADLQRFSSKLGANFIHCYDWSAPVPEIGLRNHVPFLDECNALGMKATVPISNYNMYLMADVANKKPWENPEAAHKNVRKIFAEVCPNGNLVAGVGMWKVFNEYELWYDRNPDHVVTVMKWIVEEEDTRNFSDSVRLPIMVDASFGMKDNIEGAGYIKDVWDRLMHLSTIGKYKPVEFWAKRFVFATNPQNDGPNIEAYLSTRLPAYWNLNNIPTPPVMFTELGSSVGQTGSEAKQAEWMTRQLAASQPGASRGMMLGACVFLNEERPWEEGPERTFGIMRFGAGTDWPHPQSNFTAKTKYPQWNEHGDPYAVDGTYPVEQEGPKENYNAVAKAWRK
jgi:hypothetical protein